MNINTLTRYLLLITGLLALTAGALPAQAGSGGGLGGLLKSAGGASEPEFLEADQAFIFSADVSDAEHIIGHWEIADQYYLYRQRISFKIVQGDATLGNIDSPPGKPKYDEYFGDMEVYLHQVNIPVQLLRGSTAAGTVTLQVEYQGCAEAGLCYPPITKTVSLALPAAGAASPAALPLTTAPQSAAPLAEQDRLAQKMASDTMLLTLASFFGLGVLLAFTPCVFPMIPILSSIIAGQGEHITTRRAFTMSLTYVLAMAFTYTVAGVIAGLFGENLQAAFQNPWILGSFSAVFVLLAFSMFGFYELQLPSGLQSRLAEFSNRQQGGTLVGVAIMGLLSALIVGPCVAPPLAGALIYIGQSGDAFLGGAALFALSLGMGLPLLAIGTSAGKLLPKAGPWMDNIKAVFGVLLLAIAIWMMERILPATVTMALWAVLMVISGIYLGAIEPLHYEATGWKKLWKGIGLVLLLYGTLLLVGAASGGKDPLQPLQGISLAAAKSGAPSQSQELRFTNVKNLAELESRLKSAQASATPVMLDFYADWCVSCKEMERYTFSDPGVQQALAGYTLLQADVTANNDDDKAMLKHFGLIGPPSIMFFNKNG
ncbi:MAG: thiol:disulfide interchange protein, partial [Gammaproteobacteria bacterium RBG_16_57_12]